MTSIFPDSPRNCYRPGIKSAIRKAESLEAGDLATVTVELIDF
jgi:hypothetical protein